MSIEAATSSISVTSTSSSTNTSNTSSKTSSDASFKDEMTKVSTTEEKKESKEVSKESAKDTKSNDSKEKTEVLGTEKSSEKKTLSANNQDNQNQTLDAQITFNSQFAMNDANMMLSNDIAQMVENSASLSSVNKSWTIGFGSESKSNIKMNESDAQFFLNLTQDGDVSMQNIAAQGQNMLNSGADAAEVKQNVQVSQTLLNALNEARQNNQPIRIDFDQNIAVILRVGRDGAISAQFIPSDKVAEQYLKSNIDQLRASFDEQDLPYSDLSYSHSSKEQNKKRREQAQQGE